MREFCSTPASLYVEQRVLELFFLLFLHLQVLTALAALPVIGDFGPIFHLFSANTAFVHDNTSCVTVADQVNNQTSALK
jgi:hypothetical protein